MGSRQSTPDSEPSTHTAQFPPPANAEYVALTRTLAELRREQARLPENPTVDQLRHELNARRIELELRVQELREAGQRVDALTKRYADLYDHAPIGYATLDRQGTIRELNVPFATMVGRERSQLLGTPLAEIVARAESPAYPEFVDQVMRQSGPVTREVQLHCAGNRLCDVRMTGIARRDPVDDVGVCRVAFLDVTAAKQQQQTLRLHSAIMHNMREGVCLVRDSDGVILETNPALDAMFGYAAGELPGRHVSVLNAGNGETPIEIARRIQNTLGTERHWEGEIPAVRRDGTLFWSEANICGFTHETHGAVWLTVQRDITERKRLQQQERERHNALAHTARVNTVGELAAALGHEITQPLMAIEHVAFAARQMLQRGEFARNDLLDLVAQIEQQSHRAGEVIHRLRKFVRDARMEKRSIDLHDTIRNAIKLLTPSLADLGISIRVDEETPLPAVRVDPVQIEQVIVNLVRNSMDAIVAANSASREITIALHPRPGGIQVSVHDTGPGLSPEHACIFDVFGTGRKDGVGLGLAISRSIIHAHGGTLWADPAAASGASFHFTIPLAESVSDGT
jgi:PAS domain S-box-containing protein